MADGNCSKCDGAGFMVTEEGNVTPCGSCRLGHAFTLNPDALDQHVRTHIRLHHDLAQARRALTQDWSNMEDPEEFARCIEAHGRRLMAEYDTLYQAAVGMSSLSSPVSLGRRNLACAHFDAAIAYVRAAQSFRNRYDIPKDQP